MIPRRTSSALPIPVTHDSAWSRASRSAGRYEVILLMSDGTPNQLPHHSAEERWKASGRTSRRTARSHRPAPQSAPTVRPDEQWQGRRPPRLSAPGSDPRGIPVVAVGTRLLAEPRRLRTRTEPPAAPSGTRPASERARSDPCADTQVPEQRHRMCLRTSCGPTDCARRPPASDNSIDLHLRVGEITAWFQRAEAVEHLLQYSGVVALAFSGIVEHSGRRGHPRASYPMPGRAPADGILSGVLNRRRV